MIPLDELSRSHFVIFEIPVSSSGIYNANSSRLALVQVAPQNFIPTWDEVKSDELLAQQAGESRNQVQRFIRLTELISELLDMVDERKLAFNPAVEVSYLKRDEQRMLLEAMDAEQTTPSLSQAQRLKKFSQEGRLTEEAMSAIGELTGRSVREDVTNRIFERFCVGK